jgi:hypothetical protein
VLTNDLYHPVESHSTDGATLLSFEVLTKMSSLRSLILMLYSHNGNVVLRPSLRTCALRTLISVGACTLPRHTSPIITHPSGSF